MLVLRFLVSSRLLVLSGLVALLLMVGSVSAADKPSETPLMLASFVEDEKRGPFRRVPDDEAGAEKGAAGSSWAIHIDNDLFALAGHDRDYTGGLSLTLSGAAAEQYLLSLDGLLVRVNGLFAIDPVADEVLHSFEFGMNAFTPEDTGLSTVQYDDRPYASLLYLSSTRQQLNRRKRSSVVTSFTLGALGLNIGSALQNGIHSVVGSDQAQGWHNQISDGGELTFRYSVAHQKTNWARYRGGMDNLEIKTALRGSVGYLTGATAGVSGRWGRIASPWWSFNPHLSGYAEKSSAIATSANDKAGQREEFYFWAGANLHLRGYNALLQGQFRDSALRYSGGELQRLLLESWLGLTKSFRNGFRVSYLIRNQTSELKSGNGDRAITWGGLIIGRRF